MTQRYHRQQPHTLAAAFGAVTKQPVRQLPLTPGWHTGCDNWNAPATPLRTKDKVSRYVHHVVITLASRSVVCPSRLRSPDTLALAQGKGMSQRQRIQPPPPVASFTLRFFFVRAWWRLLLLLRCRAPRVLRAGLWAPWLFPAWRSVRFLGSLFLVLLRVLLVLLLPFLLGFLFFS